MGGWARSPPSQAMYAGGVKPTSMGACCGAGVSSDSAGGSGRLRFLPSLFGFFSLAGSTFDELPADEGPADEGPSATSVRGVVREGPAGGAKRSTKLGNVTKLPVIIRR